MMWFVVLDCVEQSTSTFAPLDTKCSRV